MKWLGLESSNSIINIKAAHASTSNLGLKMVFSALKTDYAGMVVEY